MEFLVGIADLQADAERHMSKEGRPHGTVVPDKVFDKMVRSRLLGPPTYINRCASVVRTRTNLRCEATT